MFILELSQYYMDFDFVWFFFFICSLFLYMCVLFFIQPQLIWDYPLNLSILMRGGKETNKDFLSSGERKEISSALSHFVFMVNVRCSVWNILNLA